MHLEGQCLVTQGLCVRMAYGGGLCPVCGCGNETVCVIMQCSHGGTWCSLGSCLPSLYGQWFCRGENCVMHNHQSSDTPIRDAILFPCTVNPIGVKARRGRRHRRIEVPKAPGGSGSSRSWWPALMVA